MANRVTCKNCGASYDVSKFEPGKRLRCKGEGCGNVIVVPEPDAEAPEDATEEAPEESDGDAEDSGDDAEESEGEGEDAEEEEAEERPRRGEKGTRGREKGRPSERAGKRASGRREAEAGGREGRSASGRAKSASGRGRAAAESGRGKSGRQAGGGNKKFLVIGIAAVVLLGLGSLPFVLGGGSEKPAEKPKKGKAGAAATPEPETPPADAEPAKPGDAKASPEDKAPADGAKKPKGLFAFRFEEDPAGAPALQILPKLGDEEPTKAEAARDELVKVGEPAISTSLNYLYDLKDGNEANMNRVYYAIEAFKLILGEKADKVPKTGDDANPDGRDWTSTRRACNTWKDWWRKNGGKVAP